MPTYPLNLTLNASATHLSQAVRFLRIAFCLALAGCSSEVVPPIQSQAPIIVVQPSVAANGKGVRITATINPNRLDTDCYFEYGPSTAYGRQLETKFLQSTLNDVQVGDTISNLSADTTYHCRLVATNSAGTTQSNDKEFSLLMGPTGPPVVSSELVFAANTLEISAKVFPNGPKTQCYLEYGPTTAYGSQLPAKWLGPAFDTLLFVDTIDVVPPGTTTHFRLVAINANGRRESADKALKGFVYPLAAGTIWNYRYIYSFHYITGEQTEKRGHQVWRSTGTGTANATTILLTRIDTTLTWFPFGSMDTTTLITRVDTSFSIAVTPYSYDIQWYQFARFTSHPNLRGWFSVPRVVEAESDTVTIPEGRLQQSSFLRTISVHGVGLISWQDYNSSNYRWNEQLILESFSQ